jgi:hypothetical protein
MIASFEQTGRIGFPRLVALASALGTLTELARLFPVPAARSLDELDSAFATSGRKRGRTISAPTGDRAR